MQIEYILKKLRGYCVSLELEDGKVAQKLKSSIVNSNCNFLRFRNFCPQSLGSVAHELALQLLHVYL